MKKGFTLLEILLVIAAIGVLAAIVIIAINPTRQLAQVRNTVRRSDTNSLRNAFAQYDIENESYPIGLTTTYQEICAQDASDCTGYFDAQGTLVPTYIAQIPQDPQATGNGSGYEVSINPVNSSISIRSINAELSEEIAINPSAVIEYATGALDPSFDGTAPHAGGVYAGGIQTNGGVLYGGQDGPYRLNADGTLDNVFYSNAGDPAFSGAELSDIEIQSDNKILASGGFTTWNGVSVGGLVRVNTDGTIDTTFNNGGIGFDDVNYTNARVYSVEVEDDGQILVAGLFNRFNGGVIPQGVARLNSDGSLDTTFMANRGVGPQNSSGTSPASIRSIIELSDGKILVAGTFERFDGVVRSRVARLNADGSLDTSFNPATISNATSVEVRRMVETADGKYYVAGWFDTVGGIARQNLVRLNNDGSLDTSFDHGVPNGSGSIVYGLLPQSDGKIIIGGAFSSISGIARYGLARLNNDGSLDTDFNVPEFNSTGTYVIDIVQGSDESEFYVFGYIQSQLTRVERIQ